MGLTIAKKTGLAEKNPLHMNVLVAESERPALRNHRDNTRSMAYSEGSKTPLRPGSNGNNRVACEENKTPSGRFRNSAGVEKKTKIEQQKVEKEEKTLNSILFYDSVKKLKEIGKIESLADNCDDETAITVPRIAKVRE
jgi:hypothetical protein